MLDFDKKARTANYNSRHKVTRMIEGVTRCDKRGNEDQYTQSKMLPINYCSSNQQEDTTMVWPCHEERGRVN